MSRLAGRRVYDLAQLMPDTLGGEYVLRFHLPQRLFPGAHNTRAGCSRESKDAVYETSATQHRAKRPANCWPRSSARKNGQHGYLEPETLKGTQAVKTLLNIVPIEGFGCQKGRGWRTAATQASILILLLTSFAAGQTLSGSVKDSTTGKPSAGDEVVLFKLGQGMGESGRTRTDADGLFHFKLEDPQAAHLVRVIHQGVSYHHMSPPGTKSIAIEVYDVAKKVDGVKVFADIMRIRSAEGQLAVTREFAVQNTSNPRRTQMSERNLEFYVPDHARVIADSATATIENGIPLKSAPLPENDKNRYSFLFPLRPGLTRFAVTYQLPYSGSANLDPRTIYPLEHFVVTLPKGMRFKASASSAPFKFLQFPNQPNGTVRVASSVTAGQHLAFSISGEGAHETGQQRSSQDSTARYQSSTRGAPPGGGLGPPIGAPDPLYRYRWWVLGGAAAVLLFGGIYVARPKSTIGDLRRQKGPSLVAAMQPEGDYQRPAAAVLEGTRVPVAARSASILMNGIREELFQIEVEHKRGHLSQAEYEIAKAALDQTLDRALKRGVQKA